MDAYRGARVMAVSVALALGATAAGCARDMGTSGSGLDNPGPDMAGEESGGPERDMGERGETGAKSE